MGGSKTQTISLGQGQGPIAAQMIDRATREGTWVVLQNCHLATSWMPTLERICEETITPDNTHPDFRLWLTSYPSDKFPVSILQNGLKMTNEPPKGIRANLLRSYLSDPISDPAFFCSSQKQHIWQKLLFGLTFFHALVQERRAFGPLGWNIPYEFNESDLRISIRQIQMFLDEYEEVPLEALTYLTVRRLNGVNSTDNLELFVKAFDLIRQEGYSLCEGGLYYIPAHGPYETYVDYIRSLPISAEPGVFGLHSNADITKDNQETNQLLEGVLLTLPRQSGGGAKSPQVCHLYPTGFYRFSTKITTNCRSVCVRLTSVVRASLLNMRKALKGQMVMSSELESVFNSMLVGKVPSMWAAKSYPSLKPMGSYITDLLARLHFLQARLTTGTRKILFMSRAGDEGGRQARKTRAGDERGRRGWKTSEGGRRGRETSEEDEGGRRVRAEDEGGRQARKTRAGDERGRRARETRAGDEGGRRVRAEDEGGRRARETSEGDE
ncbi:hypothetical protein NL108_007571 [Boleophthalmus pectinirostris]|nr:hypothetical protein NL108_007571 [Boleophthalmus pectinirostris]